jgi:hypothetical protein
MYASIASSAAFSGRERAQNTSGSSFLPLAAATIWLMPCSAASRRAASFCNDVAQSSAA